MYGNNYNGAQIYAFPKAALAAGAPVVTFVQFESPELSDGTPSFTVWPAQSPPGGQYATNNGGTEYFLSSTAAEETLNQTGLDNRIGAWALSNTGSLNSPAPAVTLSSRILASETYGVPPWSEQKFGSVPLRDCLVTACLPGIGPSLKEVEGPLDSNDSRMQQTWYVNGKLYGALDTIVNVSDAIKAGTAWFVVDPAAPAVASQGYVAVARHNVNYPAIAVLPSGKGVIAATLVGTNQYPSAAYVEVRGLRTAGGVHVAGRGKGPEDGFCEYLFYNCGQTEPPSIRPRWGDYGAAVVAGDTLWFASEWIAQTCTISQYQSDPTCGRTRAPLGNWSTHLTALRP